MYGLPVEFDASFLVSRTLEQICFNQNQIAFHFDDGLSITVESAFSHIGLQSPSNATIVDVPVRDSDLMQLLGVSVAKASGDENGTLTLLFDNGHALKCFDTSQLYESYKINHRGEETIV